MADILRGGLFVDNANLIHSLGREQTRRLRLNFAALPRVLEREASKLAGRKIEFSVRQLYSTYRPGFEGREKKLSFLARLKDLGWSISERAAKEYKNGRWADKGTDLEIALDAHGMAFRGFIGCVAILTDDADFAALFERLPLDVKGFAVGWERSMAVELRRAATPIFLEPILGEIEVGAPARLGVAQGGPAA